MLVLKACITMLWWWNLNVAYIKTASLSAVRGPSKDICASISWEEWSTNFLQSVSKYYLKRTFGCYIIWHMTWGFEVWWTYMFFTLIPKKQKLLIFSVTEAQALNSTWHIVSDQRIFIITLRLYCTLERCPWHSLSVEVRRQCSGTVPSFHHVSSRDQTHIFRSEIKHL